MKTLEEKSRTPFSKIAFLAMVVGIFLIFTPFEDSGDRHTMLPRYLTAGASICLFAPLLLCRRIRLTSASMLVLVVLFTIIFHVIFIRPVPSQFVLLIIANFMLAIFIYEARANYRFEFEAAIECILILNFVVIAVQVGSFYFVTLSILDIHRLVFGSESRTNEDFLNIARFSGLHVEPGTYTNYVSCLLGIYVFSSDVSKRVLIISVLSMFSVLMSHSASSMFFVSVMLLLFGWLWRDRITVLQVFLVLCAMAFYIYESSFLEHLLTRFGGDDGSMYLKKMGINTYLQANLEEKFIGFGFGDDPCTACHYQDIGVVLNLVSRGGIILAVAFGLLVVRAVRLHGILLAALLFSIPVYCIMMFYELPIWLFMLMATSSRGLLAKGTKTRKRHATEFEFARDLDITFTQRPRAVQSEFANFTKKNIP